MADVMFLSSSDQPDSLDDAITALGHTAVNLQGAGVYAGTSFSGRKLLILGSALSTEFNPATASHLVKLFGFISDGGVVVIMSKATASTNYRSAIINPLAGAHEDAADVSGGCTIADATHALFTTPNTLADADFAAASIALPVDIYDTAPDGATALVRKTSTGRVVMFEKPIGEGLLIVLGASALSVLGMEQDVPTNQLLWENVITYALGFTGTATSRGTIGYFPNSIIPALIVSRLEAEGYTVQSVENTYTTLLAANLSDYDHLIIRERDPGGDDTLDSPIYANRILNYIQGGGNVFFVNIDDDATLLDPFLTNIMGAAITVGIDILTPVTRTIQYPDSRWFNSPNLISDAEFETGGGILGSTTPTWIATPNVSAKKVAGWDALMTRDANGDAVMAYKRIGEGHCFIWFEDQANVRATSASADWVVNVIRGFDAADEGVPGVAGADEAGFYCAPAGSTVEQGDHSNFNAALVLDLGLKKVCLWRGLPFTSVLTLPAGCAGSFEMPDGKYFGTRSSHIAKFGKEGIFADGPWHGTTKRLTVVSGDANTVTVAEDLPTYGDRLSGFTITLVKNYGLASETRQEREVVTNELRKLRVYWPLTPEGETWDSNPAAGDVVFIGLIRPEVTPLTMHTPNPSYLSAVAPEAVVEADIQSDQVALSIKSFIAEGVNRSMRPADYETAASERITTLEEVDREGTIKTIPPDNRYAHAVKIAWDQPPEGTLILRKLIGEVTQ